MTSSNFPRKALFKKNVPKKLSKKMLSRKKSMGDILLILEDSPLFYARKKVARQGVGHVVGHAQCMVRARHGKHNAPKDSRAHIARIKILAKRCVPNKSYI